MTIETMFSGQDARATINQSDIDAAIRRSRRLRSEEFRGIVGRFFRRATDS